MVTKVYVEGTCSTSSPPPEVKSLAFQEWCQHSSHSRGGSEHLIIRSMIPGGFATSVSVIIVRIFLHYRDYFYVDIFDVARRQFCRYIVIALRSTICTIIVVDCRSGLCILVIFSYTSCDLFRCRRRIRLKVYLVRDLISKFRQNL